MPHGNIFAVYDKYAGSVVSTNATSGDTTLYLLNVGDFSVDGGSAVVIDRHGRSAITYTGIQDDPSPALLGVTGLDADYNAQVSEVRILPYNRTRYAEVQESEEDDTITARVPHHLYQWLRKGSRDNVDGQAEHVIYHWDEIEWYIVDILGQHPLLSSDAAPPQRIFRYRAYDNSPGATGRKFDEYSGTAYACKAAVAVAPTSDATFDVLFNGVSIATLTVLAGTTESTPLTPLAQAFVETDVWQVTQTDPADSTPTLTVYIYVELDVD